jgi:hypothetical protein
VGGGGSIEEKPFTYLKTIYYIINSQRDVKNASFAKLRTMDERYTTHDDTHVHIVE